ncbi:MAG: hypothetical protein ACQEVA_20125 [Myxococcota bacterium]
MAKEEQRISAASSVFRWVLLLVVAILFISAVQLMKLSAHELQPALKDTLRHVIDGDPSALGASWLSAYVMVSGSVVAAISLTFFESTLITGSELVMMIFGSRFGAAGIIVLVGLLDAAHEHEVSIEDGSSMGFLTFLAAFAIGIPAGILTWGWATLDLSVVAASAHTPTMDAPEPGPFQHVSGLLIDYIGAPAAFVIAVVLLVAALRLFARALSKFDITAITNRLSTVLANRWWAATLGLGLTLLTTSVAFSVAALVPLFNRRVLDREQMLPYIIGANVGTLGDTLLISVLLGRPEGVELTVISILALVVVSIATLLTYGRFRAFIFSLETRLTENRRAALTAIAVLVLSPAALLATAWL